MVLSVASKVRAVAVMGKGVAEMVMLATVRAVVVMGAAA